MRLSVALALIMIVAAGLWIGSRSAVDHGEPASASAKADGPGETSDPVASDPSARMTAVSQHENVVQRPGVGKREDEPASAIGDFHNTTNIAPVSTPPPPSESADRADAGPTLNTISPLELEERWSGYDYDYVREIWAYVDGEIKVFGGGAGFRALHAQLREDLVRSESWSGPLPEPLLSFTVIDGSGRTRVLSVGEWWISDGQRLSLLDEARAQQYRALMDWRLGRPEPVSPEHYNAALAARIEAYRQGEGRPGGLDPRPHAPMPTLATAP
jgi:hypothetical protein